MIRITVNDYFLAVTKEDGQSDVLIWGLSAVVFRRPLASHVKCKRNLPEHFQIPLLNNSSLTFMFLSHCLIGSKEPTPTWLKWILRSAVHANIVWPRPDALVPRAVDHLRPVSYSSSTFCPVSTESLYYTHQQKERHSGLLSTAVTPLDLPRVSYTLTLIDL